MAELPQLLLLYDHLCFQYIISADYKNLEMLASVALLNLYFYHQTFWVGKKTDLSLREVMVVANTGTINEICSSTIEVLF